MYISSSVWLHFQLLFYFVLYLVMKLLFKNIIMFSVNDPDFKAGVTSLAMMLQIPPYEDHLEQLKVTFNFVHGFMENCLLI